MGATLKGFARPRLAILVRSQSALRRRNLPCLLLCRKRLKRDAKFQVHDPENQGGKGDRVEIVQCRPLSKTKSWRLVKVIEKAPAEVTHVTTQDVAAAG